MMSRTKVERYLEEQKASYQPPDFNHIVEGSFAEELQKRGIDPALICKTLVVKGNKTGVTITLIPLNDHLDHKKTRQVTNSRKVGFPEMDSVLTHTGYPHGVNTPIGIKLVHPDYCFLAGSSLKEKKEVIVSSGEIRRSLQIRVANLEKIVHPIYVDLISQMTRREAKQRAQTWDYVYLVPGTSYTICYDCFVHTVLSIQWKYIY